MLPTPLIYNVAQQILRKVIRFSSLYRLACSLMDMLCLPH